MGSTRHDLKQALVFLRQGKRKAAEAAIRKVLKKEPRNPDALHLLGVCHYLAGRKRPAITWLRKAAVANPNNADVQNRLGLALHADGQGDQAVEAFRRALTLDPNLIEAHNNLGNFLLAVDQTREALDQYRIALARNPEFTDAHYNMGNALLKDGRPAEALDSFRAVVDLSPDYSSAWAGMGSAQKDLGNELEAQSCYRKALELAPDNLGTWSNLHAVLYDDQDSEPACQCLEQALRIDGRDTKVHFFLGVARARQGKQEEADKHFDVVSNAGEAESYRLDSWSYIDEASGANTRLLGTSAKMLSLGVGAARTKGMVLEFGVRYGTSIRQIAAHANQDVHGFDTFVGLPEDWHQERAGSYSTCGELPKVPDGVYLHRGLFEDTLPPFLDNTGGNIRLMNVDCDLYSSTKTIFDHVRERITRGTVIIFDEYIGYPHWREDEFRAFQEAVHFCGWKYEYLAFSLFSKQAVVRIQ